MGNLSKSLLISIFALCFGLIIAELALREFGPSAKSPIVTDPVLNHKWRPSSQYLHSEWKTLGIPDYLHQYNSQSWLANYEVSKVKAKNTFRIFFVGDSFTEGTTAIEHSLPSKVSANLAPKFKGQGLELEVINTGTNSYAPTLYYLLLASKIANYEPDLVIINVDMTDVFDDYIYKQCLVLDDHKQPIACPPGGQFFSEFERTDSGLRKKLFIENWLERLEDSSALATFLNRLVFAIFNRPFTELKDQPKLFDWCRENWSEETTNQVKYSLAMLERSIALAKSLKINIALTAVPHLEQFQGSWSPKPFETIRELSVKNEIHYIDSFNGLKHLIGSQDPRQFYLPGDMHFNEAGYEAWANVVADSLLKNRDILLLPSQ